MASSILKHWSDWLLDGCFLDVLTLSGESASGDTVAYVAQAVDARHYLARSSLQEHAVRVIHDGVDQNGSVTFV